jgi:hypothetical protein
VLTKTLVTPDIEVLLKWRNHSSSTCNGRLSLVPFLPRIRLRPLNDIDKPTSELHPVSGHKGQSK